ncbi:MAG: dihydrolipoyl dehydrogenase [Acidobacteriota bacterium]|nr:dihydrolipoyl dehydrogenase [Acidobacteriota bacterium]
MSLVEIRVPDMGDFEGVDVVEVLIAAGDRVGEEDSLITLETDKASMEVPAPQAGTIKEVKVEVGSKVNTGDLIALMEAAGEETAAAPVEEPAPAPAVETPEPARPASRPEGEPDQRTDRGDHDYDVVVLGSGPGGYTAAFRASDLGLKTAIVERDPYLGGVCLNVGCIPSKALLHMAKVVDEAASFADHGVTFSKPQFDLDKLRGWKNGVIKQLTGGLEQLAKRRKVDIIQGTGTFSSPNTLDVNSDKGKQTVSFAKCIIAAGSEPARIPGIPYDDPRVIDSTGALEMQGIPGRMLVIGGGIIGLEMATVYEALGARITVVELLDRLIPGCDKDLVRPLEKRIRKRYENIFLSARVTGVSAKKDGLHVTFEGKGVPQQDVFDRVLVAVGRKPNGHKIGAGAAGVQVDERGFIPTNDQQRTNIPHIFAIGDIASNPMLAHKATHEGKVAAEVAAGLKSGFDARVIPSVAYTDPEVAWVGLTEEQAKAENIAYGKGTFPWAASGRSLALGRNEGMTKLLFDEKTDRIIGAGIVGSNAGDLIAEAGLAIEMGADATDIGLTIHAHPTLSETVNFAAEAFEGTITDLYIPKKKKK